MMSRTYCLSVVPLLLSISMPVVAGVQVRISSGGASEIFSVETVRDAPVKPEPRSGGWTPTAAPLRSLAERPDAERVAAIWRSHFFDCGTTGEQLVFSQPAPQLSFAELWTPELLLVADPGGAKAGVVRLSSSSLITPPCPVAVESSVANLRAGLVAVIGREVRALQRVGQGEANWTATLDDETRVFIHTAASKDSPALVLQSADSVLDVTRDERGHLILLQARQGTNWFNPANWLLALAGHQEVSVSVMIAAYDDRGVLQFRNRIAKRSRFARAEFVTE